MVFMNAQKYFGCYFCAQHFLLQICSLCLPCKCGAEATFMFNLAVLSAYRDMCDVLTCR